MIKSKKNIYIISFLLSPFLIPCVYGKCKIIPSFNGIQAALKNLDPQKKFVVLSFDDGPSAYTTPLILKILSDYHIKTTFFVIGRNGARFPHLLRDIDEGGHELANHSMSHPNFARTGSLVQKKELEDTNHIIETETQHQPQWFRPPYGASNDSLNRILETLNLKPVLWSIDPQDWANPPVERLIKNVMDKLHNGAVILLHDHHANTVKALPELIRRIEASDYEIVTVGEWYQRVCDAQKAFKKKMKKKQKQEERNKKNQQS